MRNITDRKSPHRRSRRIDCPAFFDRSVNVGLAYASYPERRNTPLLAIAVGLDPEEQRAAQSQLEQATCLRILRNSGALALELRAGNRSLGIICRTAPVQGDPLLECLVVLDESARRTPLTSIDVMLFAPPQRGPLKPAHRVRLERIHLSPRALDWRFAEEGTGSHLLTVLHRQTGIVETMRAEDNEEFTTTFHNDLEAAESLGSDLAYALVTNDPTITLHTLAVPPRSGLSHEFEAMSA